MEQWGIPLAALIVAIATLVLSQVDLRKKAGTDYVRQLHERLQACEERGRSLERLLRDCEQGRDTLVRENIELNRQLARLVIGRGPVT